MLIKTLKTIISTDASGQRVTFAAREIFNFPPEEAERLIKSNAAIGIASQLNISIKPEKIGS